MSHLNNLIAVALADGTLDQTEWDRLATIAANRGVSQEELHQIREEAETIKFVAPASHRDKIFQIYELVEVMIADGRVDQEELLICRKLAEKLSIHPRIITDMLARMLQLIREDKDPEIIIDEICALTNH
ncbi:hypothetical protein [Fulvivirga sedimenti]|uniref:TerB family tellurite resistance protein n=1 Tax=Fulvivirga sedimenti TaxID=2879465 RepID=A0A9X1KXN1_9BACT|nr:hypothetical protein [Fulvivirga sedimenti]MCA6074783.1 hypothetical protein [Fulvivirga sedimenti]MCA6075960.1 hypothetical protein [Fulvivirga sedimenti]MCA6077088.1 hypothetical protein [Fulvivirga sedimenti]